MRLGTRVGERLARRDELDLLDHVGRDDRDLFPLQLLPGHLVPPRLASSSDSRFGKRANSAWRYSGEGLRLEISLHTGSIEGFARAYLRAKRSSSSRISSSDSNIGGPLRLHPGDRCLVSETVTTRPAGFEPATN